MAVAGSRASEWPDSEGAIGVVRLVLALSAAVGGMLTLIGLASGGLGVLFALPTVLMVVAMARGAVRMAARIGAVLWIALLPAAPGEAIIAPMAMIGLCVAIAVGPGRLLDWIGRDAVGRSSEADAVGGWIEDDVRRRG